MERISVNVAGAAGKEIAEEAKGEKSSLPSPTPAPSTARAPTTAPTADKASGCAQLAGGCLLEVQGKHRMAMDVAAEPWLPPPRSIMKWLLTLVNVLTMAASTAMLVLVCPWVVEVWREHGLAEPCPVPVPVGRVLESAVGQKLTAVALLEVLFVIPGAVWITVSSSTLQLQFAGHLAVINWFFRVLRLVQELPQQCCPLQGKLSSELYKSVNSMQNAAYLYMMMYCLTVAWSRVAAVEASSHEDFGGWLAGRLVALGLPIGLFGQVWFTFRVNSPAAVDTALLAGFVFWLAWTCSVLIRSFLLMQKFTSRAAQSPLEEVAAAAKLSARTLRAQSNACIFALAVTLAQMLAFIPQLFHPDVAAHAVEDGCGDSAPWLVLRLVEGLLYDLDFLAVAWFTLSLTGATSGAINAAAARRTAARRRRARWRKASTEWGRRHRQTQDRPQALVQGQAQAETEAWESMVIELAGRGVSLDALITFYQDLRRHMPDYDPFRHTTLDVVRRAIIPLSSVQQCACSVLLMQGRYTRPDRLVTHTWSGRFHDLIAAAASDALEEPSYALVSRLLARDPSLLASWLAERGLGGRTYWICAFAVNQHLSICGSNTSGRRDSVSGLPHPTCSCGLRKAGGDTPPLLADGRSIPCEMNKFDDLMRYLSATDRNFQQVVAIDMSLDIFTRAWCIAELATARQGGMQQHLRVPFADIIDTQGDQLRNLKIQDMHSSRPEDKRRILDSIPDVDEFNSALHTMLFHELIPSWTSLDPEEQLAHAGRVIRWQRTLMKWDTS